MTDGWGSEVVLSLPDGPLAGVSASLAVLFVGLAVCTFLRSGAAFRVGRGGVHNLEQAADVGFFVVLLLLFVGELLGIKSRVVRDVILLAIAGVVFGGALALALYAWQKMARLVSGFLTRKTGHSGGDPKGGSSPTCC